ncbi:MAG: sulfatase-like hydrolase/transferase [Myxococcales bacterium]|nr:sulfatase-like hydrolase/transferase [Myxococcales bacterium]
MAPARNDRTVTSTDPASEPTQSQGSQSSDTTPATSPHAPDAKDPHARASDPRLPSVPPPGSSFALASEAAALALATAVLGSLPAALRVARAGGSFVGGWLAAGAIVLPALAVLIYLTHAAGRGYRMLTGQGAGRATALGLALWVGLLAPLLMLLGTVLKANTNHRGLGGATFGVLGVVLAAGTALVARRVVVGGRWLVERGASPRVVAGGFAAIAIGPMLALSLPLLRESDAGAHAPAVAAALIDGAIFAVATSVAVAFGPGDELRARARRLGLAAGAAFVLVGIGWLSVSQPLGVALRSGGGLAAAIVGGLERWTDRDGDGRGALFGGQDCDEGDPRRFRGAADPPNDGIDQDCDGFDGAPAVAAAEPTPTPVQAAASPPRPDSSPTAGPPSVLLVTLDTVRADKTSAYGFDKPTTPRLEVLASQGALFEHAYAPGTDTQRALAHLFSGQGFDETAKDRREWPTLKDENDTLAERLKRAGYATAAVSSFQWLSRERGFAQGFDSFVEVFEDEHPERGTTGPRAVQAARAIWEKAAAEPRPLFLWVHLFDAHAQYKTHAGFDFGRGKLGAYLGEIAFTDKQLGDLLDAVASSPRAATTAVIVHGSQGEAFDEHGTTGHGKDLYEEVLRIPLVVSLPKGSAPAGGKRYGASAVSSLDLAPTILDLAGVSQSGVAGQSLLPLVRGEASAKRSEPVYARAGKRYAVIDYPLKLVLQERKGKDRLLLFDLAADPGETRDLSEQRAADLTRLSDLVRARFSLKDQNK